MKTIRNSETTPLIVSGVILFAGFAMMLVPIILKLEMMQWGFGIIFLGGFVVLSGLISGIVFGIRFRKFLQLCSGENVIAHWTHSEEGFDEQLERDFQDRRRGNFAKLGVMLFFIVTITAAVAGFGYVSGEGDSMPIFIGIMIGVGALLSLVAVLAPKWDKRRALRNARDTYIAEHAIYTQGTLHSWGTVASRLVGISLEDEGEAKRLVFSIDYAAHVGFPQYINHTVDVPIPRGEEARAQEIAERLSKQCVANQ